MGRGIKRYIFAPCFVLFFSLKSQPIHSPIVPGKAGGAEATCHHGDSSLYFMPEQFCSSPEMRGHHRGAVGWSPTQPVLPLLQTREDWPDCRWKPDLSPKAIFKNVARCGVGVREGGGPSLDKLLLHPVQKP